MVAFSVLRAEGQNLIKEKRILPNLRFFASNTNDPKSPESEVVHETKFSLKISYSTHVWLAQLDKHQTREGQGCEFNSHSGQLYFLLNILKLLDVNFGKKRTRNVKFELFVKTSIERLSNNLVFPLLVLDLAELDELD